MSKFIAEVIDVNDPEKAGRLKIRIYGMHDDKSRVPDSALPWVRCIFPVTNPARGNTSGAITGVVVGTKVVGVFMDPESMQIPLIEGTLGRSIEDKGGDFPKGNIGEDFNSVLNNTIHTVGASEAKYAVNKTIGSIKYLNNSINDMIGSIEGVGGITSAIGKIKNIKNQISSLKNAIQNAPDQLSGILTGAMGNIGNRITNQITGAIGDAVDDALGSIPLKIPTNNIGVIFSNPGDVVGNVIEDAVSQINPFGSVNHLIGGITGGMSAKGISSVGDVMKRINGHRFVMGSTMVGLEDAFSKIKTAKTHLNNIKSAVDDAKNKVQDARNVVGVVSRFV